MTDIRCFEQPIARTHFDSHFGFEPTNFYCILFAKYNKLGSDTSFPNLWSLLPNTIIYNYVLSCAMKWYIIYIWRVWRYQRGNHNPYIEEEYTTHRPKEKGQMDKQRSTKHTYKTKDRVTRTPQQTGGELRCSGRVSSMHRDK